MEIIPAIYILDGKCVALYKSSYEQRETYFRTPLEMALSFQREGAKRLYLVELNGKKDNTFRQKGIISEIAGKIQIPLLVEAGFNSMEELQDAFDLGADQVVIRPLSTHLIKDAVKKYGAGKIYVLIQAKGGGMIGVEKKSYEESVDVVDYAEKLVTLGVKNVVYKDERSEGTMVHPNYDEADRLFQVTGNAMKIYVSGGISEPLHLATLNRIGIAGAIIGKAFYEKRLTIAEAEATAEAEQVAE